jgi:hypothetical protein
VRKSSASLTRIVLDEPGWEQLADVLQDLRERAAAVQEQSARRLAGEPKATKVVISLVVGAHEVPPFD